MHKLKQIDEKLNDETITRPSLPVRTHPLGGFCMMVDVEEAASGSAALLPALGQVSWTAETTEWIHHCVVTRSTRAAVARQQ